MPGASATVERAREQGLDAFALPLFEIVPLDWDPPDASQFDGILLTSVNALRHGGGGLKALLGLPAYAVGEATAKAARAAGFAIAATGTAGIEGLLGSIDRGLHLVHPCGRDRIEVQSARQSITPVPVYQARAVAVTGLKRLEGCVIMIHSPRAARRLAELVDDRSSMTIAAISPAVAEAAGADWGKVEAANVPTDRALLALAARLCKKGGGQ